jgi:DnaJ-domain-containing protein 1
MEIMNNQSLNLDATVLTSDPDGDTLQYEWYMDDLDIALSTLRDFRKPLFDVEPGEHTIKLVVKDDFETVEKVFNITVIEAPKEEDDRNFIQKMLDDENFFWYALPVVILLVLIPLVVFIIFLSKRMSDNRREDFIIDEDRTMDMSSAEETARRILDHMGGRTNGEDDMEAEFDVDSDGFDFDFNLYEVLEVEQNSEVAVIKKAYRKLAAYYHPDRIAHEKDIDHDEAREIMVKVNKAKEILLNPELRERYDSYISDQEFSMDIGDLQDDGDEDEADYDDWD